MTTKTKAGGPAQRELVELPIGQVKPNPRNIRDDVDDKHSGLEKLAHSIKVQGIINPLVVFPELDEAGQVVPDSWLVADGHRRLAAATEAGLATVPVIVKVSEDNAAEAIQIMLATGTNHEALNRREEARGIQQLFDLGVSKTRISKEFKQKAAHVEAKAKLAQAPEDLQMTYFTGGLDIDGMVALQKLEDEDPELHADVSDSIARESQRGYKVSVERWIANAKGIRKKNQLEDELIKAGAKEAPSDARYSGQWSRVATDAAGDELPVQEHIDRGHKFLVGGVTTDPEVEWYAKAKSTKPGLSAAEKAEKKRLAELGRELGPTAAARDAHLLKRLQQDKPAVDEQALVEWFVESMWFHQGFEYEGEAAARVLSAVATVRRPEPPEALRNERELWDQYRQDLEDWEAKVKAKFVGFGLQKLVAIYMYLRSRDADDRLLKPQGWDLENPRHVYNPDHRPAEYIKGMQRVFGYELDEHEQAAIAHFSDKAEGGESDV